MFITTEIDGQYDTPNGEFPRVYTRDQEISLDDSLNWISEHRTQLLAQATEHGGVLFRGFAADTAQDFDQCIQAFEIENFPYEESFSNAVRVNRTPRVFTANEAPSDVTIYLHHELAQTPFFPKYLLFYCEVPAESGGATPISRSDVLVDILNKERPSFVQQCERKGLRYSNVMPEADDPESGMGRSWRSTFNVDSKSAVESRLKELNYNWMWESDGSLRATTPVLPAIQSLEDGRRTFFNQLIAAFQGWADETADPSSAITFGDGTPLSRDNVVEATRIAYDLVFDMPWQQGDFVLIDNRVCMHGRRRFVGKRSILASLAECATHSQSKE